jgi:hypothetical protein
LLISDLPLPLLSGVSPTKAREKKTPPETSTGAAVGGGADDDGPFLLLPYGKIHTTENFFYL